MHQLQHAESYLERISRPTLPIADFLKRNIFMCGVWLLGIPAFLYGAIDRGLAAFGGSAAAVTASSHCMVALAALSIWFIVGMAANPHGLSETDSIELPQPIEDRFSGVTLPAPCVAQQKYRLPFSHQCQIYHLLNLKHLEEIHRFSLGNLKVTKVSQFQKTETGGMMRFRTVLDSSTNILRMWRNPSVEVDLILHTPYQIELRVPAYRQKCIHVLFSVLPLNEEEHILSVQMFTDLQWPRELLKAILIIASSLTMLEDLPYLSQLSKISLERSQHSNPSEEASSAHSMQLFWRYIELYDNHWHWQVS
ncbi:hypothetical protein PN498_01735 [Oscillatoria sp. CS-180]|uniref:hypothetical protein n=1 Tax=Oscillatoria sp. CS-180 TaxID=3021720 RepID=UPI00233105BF|nr:hypothetical protein [Oscillatoria sp. CS-180]MDB9524696.1 hypothetical protein [Oscillatoria sp. CS-180]